MEIRTAVYTDVGTTKATNQDSVCIKSAVCDLGNICIGIICDGMGGHEKGELASATVVRAFDQWFCNEFPKTLKKDFKIDMIRTQWDSLISVLNDRISNYGKENGISLGTTLTVVLIVNNQYICTNVGDTRLYIISDSISQVTKDQTVVAREAEFGRITAEEAKTDPRRNILLQCIGASKDVKPDYFEGVIDAGQILLLCSDGFRHEVTDEEIHTFLSSASTETMEKALHDLVAINKCRGEQDNITAAVIKLI